MRARILVIDDEESMCNFMGIMLTKEGYEVATTTDPTEALNRLREADFDLVIADLHMPGLDGLEVLKQVKALNAELEVIMMTAFASVETAIEAMKQGAADYITKPFQVDEIKLIIEKALSRRRLIAENTALKEQLRKDNAFEKFIGTSEAVMQLKSLADLIRGESGTGKDVIARAIHHHSPRAQRPFVTINCAALPETLLESELFGHKKGSFTGAIKDKDGLFKVASGGTLFLDEIGNTSLGLQAKLLRVLEEKRITPVGGTQPIDIDVRLIAATNADLEKDVKEQKFRADLFYRLNVLPIFIPPLRERSEDIPLLIRHFIRVHCRKMDMEPKDITPEAMSLLTAYHWPGNVRELENTIERAILLNRGGDIDVSDFPDRLHQRRQSAPVSEEEPATPTLEAIERAYIHFIMSQTGGRKKEAARILGIDTSTLYRKLERYKMSTPGKERKQPAAG